MPELRTLEPNASWNEYLISESDWDAAEPDLLAHMFTQLQLIRSFEEYVLDLSTAGLIHGPAHSSIGQEGAAVGSVLALGPGDTVNGSHRGHHQFLAKALQHVAPKGIPLDPMVSGDVRDVLLQTLREICGLDRGFSHGRGGSMHLQWRAAGAIGTNAIVGGGVPLAAGSAWAHRFAGTDRIAVTYFGDGAVNIGSTLETFNLASAWRLPVCFFIENNQYAVSTSVHEATGEPRVSARGPGFGIPSVKVDGMDPLATYMAMSSAVEHMRAGNGPVIVEADVYRFFHQNGAFPGSAFGYRTREEESHWRARDPIALMAKHLVRRKIVDQFELTSFMKSSAAVLDEIGQCIFERAADGKPGARRIRAIEWPDVDFVDVGVRGDLSEFADAPVLVGEFSGGVKKARFVDTIAAVISRRMTADHSVIVLGEDVHRLKGGTNGATRGLFDEFPGRVLGTPISENAFVGLAGGLALDGRVKPIVELMYADFLWVAADQLFNQIAKARHMYGGNDSVPLVMRTKVALGGGYGSQHSMDPAGIMATSVGWRIVAPSTALDYVGLFNSAIRCQDPVIVLEHTDLYLKSGDSPIDDLDFCLPVGKAALRRQGSAITIISYLAMTGHVLDAVLETDTDADVIDLRWLDRASIDWETIGTSIKKTNNVLIAEQGSIGPSYGGWLADEIQRRFFDWLDAPIARVTGGEASPSISRILEAAAYASADEVAAKLVALRGT